MIFIEDEKSFVAQINEYKLQAEKNQKVILTKFLTLREQEIVKFIFRSNPSIIHMFGGYELAERKRCFIFNHNLTVDDKLFNINCFKIEYNKRYLTPTHQNVLGTLMSLKLDRALFGDILFKEQECYFFTSAEIEPILMMEFKTINRVPINLSLIDQKLEIEEQIEVKEIMVSSLRADNVISHVYRLSRSDAQALIGQGFVYRNFQVLTNNSTMCQVNDVISVRKYGRFTIGELLRTTKSNKAVLEIKIPTR